jgi:hypothetical protein
MNTIKINRSGVPSKDDESLELYEIEINDEDTYFVDENTASILHVLSLILVAVDNKS